MHLRQNDRNVELPLRQTDVNKPLHFNLPLPLLIAHFIVRQHLLEQAQILVGQALADLDAIVDYLYHILDRRAHIQGFFHSDIIACLHLRDLVERVDIKVVVVDALIPEFAEPSHEIDCVDARGQLQVLLRHLFDQLWGVLQEFVDQHDGILVSDLQFFVQDESRPDHIEAARDACLQISHLLQPLSLQLSKLLLDVQHAIDHVSALYIH